MELFSNARPPSEKARKAQEWFAAARQHKQARLSQLLEGFQAEVIEPLEQGWKAQDPKTVARGVEAWKRAQAVGKGLEKNIQGDFFFGDEGIYFRFGTIGEDACALWLEHLVSLGIVQSYERLPHPLPDFRVTLPDGSEVMWDAKTYTYENFTSEVTGSKNGTSFMDKYPAGTKLFAVTFYPCWHGRGGGQPRVFVIDVDCVRDFLTSKPAEVHNNTNDGRGGQTHWIPWDELLKLGAAQEITAQYTAHCL